MRGSCLAMVLCVVVCASTAHSSGIGAFADQLATDCDMTIPPHTPFTFYVVAWTFGDAAADCGVFGADLRLVGVPAGWFTTATPNPSGIGTGNILIEGGGIEFAACQPPGLIVLYIVSGFAVSTPPNLQIQPESRLDVTNPCSPSTRPTLTVCDQGPTRVCALQSPLFVNGPVCGASKPALGPVASGDCLIAVESPSWGAVKGLYRD